MWAQSLSQENMVTPMKRMNTQLQTRKEEMSGTSAVQLLNRPRQIQNKISRCLNSDVEGDNIQITERQLQETNKDCMTGMYAQQTRFSQVDSEEEVINSDGEPFEELYPDNTWDSDEEVHEEEKSLRSRWI